MAEKSTTKKRRRSTKKTTVNPAGCIAVEPNPHSYDHNVTVHNLKSPKGLDWSGQFIVACHAHKVIAVESAKPKAIKLMRSPHTFCSHCQQIHTATPKRKPPTDC